MGPEWGLGLANRLQTTSDTGLTRARHVLPRIGSPRAQHAPAAHHLSWDGHRTCRTQRARGCGTGVGPLGPFGCLFGPIAGHGGPVRPLSGTEAATDGSLWAVWGPNCVPPMHVPSGTHHSLLRAVRILRLEKLNSGPPQAHLRVCCCLLPAVACRKWESAPPPQDPT